mmetsp:Transcript_16068/g.22447  ORF Transcript_16068/g.22447 Transcript_16068/m.22447 type:complete len:348 (-) Transcript_16068:295-1338(-)|eukprot:CAMPEP_0184490806 /NCGR_PEP_ID=MMETSP0113_2-20130426/18919_1 /TAXON_ID=91329 /ORGANISM="Norrisiella sphaerica, Strain BC52" /LENGTH=347 /DNA_ID=CAMNT_0026874897 /DNA_START=222 /DNA_END=1265 /DNA_ORIENTATION=+
MGCGASSVPAPAADKDAVNSVGGSETAGSKDAPIKDPSKEVKENAPANDGLQASKDQEESEKKRQSEGKGENSPPNDTASLQNDSKPSGAVTNGQKKMNQVEATKKEAKTRQETTEPAGEMDTLPALSPQEKLSGGFPLARRPSNAKDKKKFRHKGESLRDLEERLNDEISKANNDALRDELLKDTDNLDEVEYSIETKLKKNAAITQTDNFDPAKFKEANKKREESNVDMDSPITKFKASSVQSQSEVSQIAKSLGLQPKVNKTSQNRVSNVPRVDDWSPKVKHDKIFGEDLGVIKEVPTSQEQLGLIDSPPANLTLNPGEGDDDPLLDSQDEAMMDAILMEQGID